LIKLNSFFLFLRPNFWPENLDRSWQQGSDFIASNTMATAVVGTGQLLELLAKAGGSPAALIYKAGTDLYDYYRLQKQQNSSPAKSTLQTAEEIY
jgi:hypothetical protein